MNQVDEQNLLEKQIDTIRRVKTPEDFEKISEALLEFYKKIVLNSLNPLITTSISNNYLVRLYQIFQG